MSKVAFGGHLPFSRCRDGDLDKLETVNRILHVSFSSTGGAGKFAQRLNDAQVKSGLDSKFLTFNKGGLANEKFQHPILAMLAALDFVSVRKDSNNPLFSLFRDNIELFDSREYLDSDTILHLHWTPGIINRKTIASILSTHKVIWTLHDMFPLTGGCHHSQDCSEFKKACENCPQIRSAFKTKLANNHVELRKLNNSFEKLILVSPSRWLQGIAQESAITSGAKTFCIPNPIDSTIFYIDAEKRQNRGELEDSEFVIGLCASDLSDPIKNVDVAVASVNSVASLFPSRRFRIIAVGRNLNKYVVNENIVLQEVGSLDSDAELAKIYRSMDIFINPSLQENYPTTLLEALAVGTPCIAWQSGGTNEIVTNDKTGYLVNSSIDLVNAITSMLDRENLMRLRNGVAFSRSKIIDLAKCVELYNEIYRYSFDS
jgi:glycosyltransferase involved in cell wall biosynthesis